MTLKDEGDRFVYNSKSNLYTWLHPAMIKDEHIDCTDMDDCSFEIFVLSRKNKDVS